MRWGREKPKGFIDDAQSYSVVCDVHAKLLSCQVDPIQIGNTCFCQEHDKEGSAYDSSGDLMDTGMLNVETAGGAPGRWAESLDQGRL
jgi:hypothetical protein